MNGQIVTCGGDPNKECCGGQCITKCDTDNCEECDGAGGCESKCGPNEECCNGECCDTTTKKCCDGECQPKCDETENETMCSSEQNTSCPGCVGALGNCSGNEARVYSNETIYNCGGGCPGDCPGMPFPTAPCYDIYYCQNYISYTFAECTAMSETGPVPLDCYNQIEFPWSCTRCQGGGYDRTMDVVSRSCQ